jgi:predicted permease
MDFGIRFWRKHWGPGLWVILILGVASGIVAVYGTFASAVWFRSLPLPDADALFALGSRRATGPRLTTVSLGEFRTIRGRQTTFLDIGSITTAEGWFLRTTEGLRPIGPVHVSHNFLDVLGIRPSLGRSFREEDTARGQPFSAILSFSAWQTLMGGVSNAIGQRLPLARAMEGPHEVQVIGVLPKEVAIFRDGRRADVLLSLPDGLPVNVELIGRLGAGVGRMRAQDQLSEVFSQMDRDNPPLAGSRVADLVPLRELWFGDVVRLLWPLAAISAFVILTALTTAVGVLLVLSTTRAHEAAVRAALGESSGRSLIRAWLESVPIAGGAVAVSIFVSQGVGTWAASFASSEALRGVTPGLSWGAVMMCAALALVVVAISSVVPAWLRARQRRLLTQLQAVTTTPDAAAVRLRKVVIAGQTTVAMALVLSAVLVSLSTIRLLTQPLGFDATGVLSARITLTEDLLDGDASYDQMFARLLAAASDGPVGRMAAITVDPPLGAGRGYRRVTFSDGTHRQVVTKAVSHGFLTALSIPLVSGRDLESGDVSCRLLVNQAFATRFLGGPAQAINQSLFLGSERCAVAGVTADVREGPLEARTEPTVYPPFSSRMARREVYIVIKDKAAGPGTAEQLRVALQAEAPRAHVFVEPLAERLRRQSAEPRFWSAGLLVLAGFALCAACLGIAATVAQVAAESRRETAIRVALGGTFSAIRWRLITVCMAPVVIGAFAGLGFAWMMQPLLTPVVVGVDMSNPGVWLLGLLGTVLLAGAAAFFGAKSVRRINVVSELRNV